VVHRGEMPDPYQGKVRHGTHPIFRATVVIASLTT
jgi:hypothetical protein